MINTSLDLTIATALADPMIAATMRADRVDPRWLKELLTMAARRLEVARSSEGVPWDALAGQARSPVAGACRKW